jgi:hypothetical protein
MGGGLVASGSAATSWRSRDRPAICAGQRHRGCRRSYRGHAIRGEFRFCSERLRRDPPAVSLANAIAAVAAPTGGTRSGGGRFCSERLRRDPPAVSLANAIAAVAAPTGETRPEGVLVFVASGSAATRLPFRWPTPTPSRLSPLLQKPAPCAGRRMRHAADHPPWPLTNLCSKLAAKVW